MNEDPKRELIAGCPGALIELAPVLVFIAAYMAAPVPDAQRIFVAIAAYMAATLAATIAAPFASNVLAAHLLQIPWLARVLVIVMGGLALALQDELFIKTQPTVYFGLVAAWSGWTAMAGKPRLQRFEKHESLRGVNRVGWRKLTRYAGWACLGMALLNELIWRTCSTGFWIGFQLWGWFLVEALLMALSLPLLKRHSALRAEASASVTE